MKRARKIAAVLALCLVGAVLALYFFRESLVHPWAVGRLEREVAERTGARLDIDRLEGDWFTQMRVEGVRWSSERPPLLELRASEVELEFSLLGLVRGRPDWLGDLRATVELVELAQGEPSGGEPGELPSALPPLSVSVDRLSYRFGGERALEATGVSALVRREARAQAVSVTAKSVTWRDPARELSTPLEASGTYAAGRVEIARAVIGETATVRESALDLTGVGRGRMSWSALVASIGGELETTGTLDGEELRVAVVARGIELAELGELIGGLPEELDASTNLDGEVFLKLGEDPRADVVIRSLEATRGVDVVRIIDLQAPIAKGGWQALVRAARGHVELDHSGDWHLLGPMDRPDLPAHRVVLSAQLEDGRAVLSGQIVTPGGVLRVDRGVLALGPNPATAFEEAELDLLLDADFDDVSTLAAMLGVEVTGSLDGAIDFDGTLLAPRGRLTAVATGVSASGVALDSAEVDIVSDGARIEIARCEFLAEPWRGSLTGSWSTGERAFEALSISVSGGAGRELVPGFAPDRLEVEVEASGPIDALAGRFDATGEGIPLGPVGSGTLVAGGTFESGVVTLERLLLQEGERTVRAAGTAGRTEDGFELAMDSLLVEGPNGSLELERPARIALRDKQLTVDELLLCSEVEGRLGRLEARADGTQVELLLDDFDPRPLLEVGLPEGMVVAGLDGTLSGRVDPAAPDVDFDLEVVGLVPRPGAPSYDLALSGRLTPERVLEAVFEGSSDEVARFELELAIPYDPATPAELFQPGPVRLAVEAEDLRVEVLDQLIDIGTLASGRGYVSAEFEGTWGDLSGGLTLRGTNLRSPETDAALGEPVELLLEAELGQRPAIRQLEVRAGQRELVRLEGALDHPFDLRGWAASPEDLLQAPLELSADFDLPLAGWVGRAQGVRRMDGVLTGRTRIDGTLQHPLFTGDVRLRDGDLRLSSAFPAIRDMNADIAFEGRAVKIVSLRGEVGAAPCELTGRIELAEAGPVLDLTLRGKNLLLARSMTLKVRADTEISLRGPLEALRAEGEIVITEGRHGKDIDVLAGLSPESGSGSNNIEGWKPSFWTAPPLSNMALDVRVTSATEFRLRGNLYDFMVRPDLYIRGTGRVPLFEGFVYVDPSLVTLPSGRFYVKSGVLEFRRDEPYSPRVMLNGEMRARGYDIVAQVTGSTDDPEVLLTSTPTLPNDQLLVLFLTGQVPQGTSDGQLEAAQSVGVFLAQDYFTRLFMGPTGTEESLLDRIVFDVGADVSRTGAPTMKGMLFLEPHRDRTGRTTYLLAERDKYDFVNYAFGIRFRFR